MSSSEINVKFQGIIMKIGKMEYFCEKINSTQGQKRKTQTNLGGVYKGREAFLTHSRQKFSKQRTRKKRITESDEQSDSPVRRVGLVQLAEQVSWIERPVQLARVESGSNGRVGSNVPVDGLSPTRQTGELDRSHRPTRPFDELDRTHRRTRLFGELDREQVSWIERPVQLARVESGSNGRVGSNVPVDGLSPTRQTGELDRSHRPTRPFDELDRTHRRTRLFGELDRTHRPTHSFGELDHLLLQWTRPHALHRASMDQSLVSYRSELPLEIYNKNREDSFPRIKFMVIV
ncbi:hypothetical protein F2Q68_00021015 [Brassica cretica]|uniref:Uncharacterized protein n=1 Tax=Brassica cretica TaxID=69181 RepID=A0A8S9G6J6_BRACR|nr:hypothetical protein F2Q68_00021015 [Brassica cretica]